MDASRVSVERPRRKPTTPGPLVGPPVPRDDRGFLSYGGGPVLTDYGHRISVYESSSASGPFVWMDVSDSPRMPGHTAHMGLDQAIMLRAALDQFINGVPERWSDGERMLAQANLRVLGIMS